MNNVPYSDIKDLKNIILVKYDDNQKLTEAVTFKYIRNDSNIENFNNPKAIYFEKLKDYHIEKR